MYWTIHLDGGPRRVNHATAVVMDKIFSFGGYCTGQNLDQKRPMDVYILNCNNYRWYPIPSPGYIYCDESPVPYQRYGHTAVEYKKKIYVWGGRNHEAACNRLFCFDSETLQWSCPSVTGEIPAARDGHSACVINNQMYIFGGFEDNIKSYSQDVYALDLQTIEWRYFDTEGDPPSRREFHSASVIDGRMYVFGGKCIVPEVDYYIDEQYCNSIVYLDTQTGIWHKPESSGDLPLGRSSHSAFVYKGHLYIFGGYHGLFNIHFNDIFQFSPETYRWRLMKPLGKPPSKRRRQSCLVVGNRVFLFGGSSPCEGPQVIDNAHNEDYDSTLIEQSDMHVLDFAPSLRTLGLMAVIQHRLDQSSLPEELRRELHLMVTPNTISPSLNITG